MARKADHDRSRPSPSNGRPTNPAGGSGSSQQGPSPGVKSKTWAAAFKRSYAEDGEEAARAHAGTFRILNLLQDALELAANAGDAAVVCELTPHVAKLQTTAGKLTAMGHRHAVKAGDLATVDGARGLHVVFNYHPEGYDPLNPPEEQQARPPANDDDQRRDARPNARDQEPRSTAGHRSARRPDIDPVTEEGDDLL